METMLRLANHWRARALDMRTWAAAEGSARALEGCADELEAAVREAWDQALTLDQAANESGYSKRRLRELLAEGAVPNAGRKGSPRIRRAELPRRPGRIGASGYNVDADADGLIGRMEAL